MSVYVKVFGTPVTVSGTHTIAVTITATDGSTPKTFTTSTAVTAGTYDPASYLLAVEEALRNGLQTAISGTSGMANVGGASSKGVTVTFAPPTTDTASFLNASLITVAITDLSATIGGNAITAITAASLSNSTGWGSNLGLCSEDTSTQNATLAGATATWSGQFQSRYLWAFLGAGQDPMEWEVAPQYRANSQSDGGLVVIDGGPRLFYRDVKLTDHDSEMLGPQRMVGTLKDVNSDRVTLEFSNPTRTGWTFGGVGPTLGPYLNSAMVPVGAYVRIGPSWVGRVRTVTVPSVPTVATVKLWDKVPTTVGSTTYQGWPIYRVSEGHAMWLEAIRLQHLLVYETNDATGAATAVAVDYGLRDDGGKLQRTWERRDAGVDRYSATFALKRRSKTGLTLVTA